MHICICKAHLQILKRSFLPCLHQKPLWSGCSWGSCRNYKCHMVLHCQGNTGGWVRSACTLPFLPVSGFTALPLKPAGTLGESSCQLLVY